MAYHSNESGGIEVYIRPFPNEQGTVSGACPPKAESMRVGAPTVASCSSSQAGQLVSVTFDGARATPVIGQPRVLFRDVIATDNYLAIGTGPRFLVARRPPVGETPLTVITNWLELLAGR